MNYFLANLNLLLVKTDVIFYILSAVFFCAFLIVLIWYLFNKKKESNKQTKTWTIESAKKFLENNNIQIKQSPVDKVKTETIKNVEKEKTKNEPKEKQKVLSTPVKKTSTTKSTTTKKAEASKKTTQ